MDVFNFDDFLPAPPPLRQLARRMQAERKIELKLKIPVAALHEVWQQWSMVIRLRNI